MFPVRYELTYYILFRRNSVFDVVTGPIDYELHLMAKTVLFEKLKLADSVQTNGSLDLRCP
jgi:hypothetical protein